MRRNSQIGGPIPNLSILRAKVAVWEARLDRSNLFCFGNQAGQMPGSGVGLKTRLGFDQRNGVVQLSNVFFQNLYALVLAPRGPTHGDARIAVKHGTIQLTA